VYDSIIYLQNFAVPSAQWQWTLNNDSIIVTSAFQSVSGWDSNYYGGPASMNMLKEEDYFSFTGADLVPRMVAILNGLKDSLVFAGVPTANVTVVEDQTVNNLRFKLQAAYNSKTFIAYVELTPVGTINNQMAIVLTLYAQGDVTEITTSYTPGAPVAYNDPVEINKVREKLVALEKAVNDELLPKAYSFLGV
jgi:hypothetical protein